MNKSINLLIARERDSPRVARLKRVAPVAAASLVAVFLLIFFISLLYTNNSIAQFNKVKKDVGFLEEKITAQKKTEEVYTISAKRIDTISQILSASTSLSPLITLVSDLSQKEIVITSSTIDEKGEIGFALVAPDFEKLDSFVTTLIEKEEVEHLFSKIYASGIVRDKKGKYTLSISFKVKPESLNANI